MRPHKWMYKVVTIGGITFKKAEKVDEILEDKLNRLGMEGWELVNIVHTSGTYPRLVMKKAG